jgi:hypothetical protein
LGIFENIKGATKNGAFDTLLNNYKTWKGFFLPLTKIVLDMRPQNKYNLNHGKGNNHNLSRRLGDRE